MMQTCREEVIVLTRQESGESGWLFHVLTRKSGVLMAYKRVSRKRIAQIPDLFDRAEITFEIASNNMAFIAEYWILGQYPSIAKNYNAFEAACWFSKLLSQNMPYGDDGRAEVFDIAETAFAAWNSQKLPGAVLLKSLYLLMKSEGYPVKQEWIAGLSEKDRRAAGYILNTPIVDIDAESNDIGELITSLQRWTKYHAHYIC